jgi:hypothetical protein
MRLRTRLSSQLFLIASLPVDDYNQKFPDFC